jgi:hypothetical protein
MRGDLLRRQARVVQQAIEAGPAEKLQVLDVDDRRGAAKQPVERGGISGSPARVRRRGGAGGRTTGRAPEDQERAPASGSSRLSVAR